MSFFDTLREEIATKVDNLAQSDQPLHPAWITHAICNDHVGGLADNEDADFWRHATHKTVRGEVGNYLRKLYGAEDDGGDRQLTLPGYEHVQVRYIVNRDGDDIAIPTPELTDEEIDAITARLRASGATLYAHADDLDRFKAFRTAPPLFAELAASENEVA